LNFAPVLKSVDFEAPLVCGRMYDKAERLFDGGDLDEALGLLTAALGTINKETPHVPGVSVSRALVLYGKALLGLGDFSNLEKLFSFISGQDLRDSAEFQLLHVQMLGKTGKIQDLISEATSFLKAWGISGHELLADFFASRFGIFSVRKRRGSYSGL